MMQYSLHVQNVEGHVNLDPCPWPWGMDTCVGCRVVEYLLSAVFLLSATSGQYMGVCFLL